jgi:hypothetical protein
MALDYKKVALDLGEDVVKRVIKDIVRPFAEAYVLSSPNKLDDTLLLFMGQLEKALLDLADKIDGEAG